MIIKDEEYINKILKLLGNPIRRSILKHLSQEPCFALQIAKDLGLGQQLIAQHLNQLEEGGLIYSTLEDSPIGPQRKIYRLSKSLIVNIDLAPHLYQDEIISFETQSLSSHFSSKKDSFNSQLTTLEKLDHDDETKLPSFVELIKKIDSQLTELTTERIALLYIRNAVMRNIAPFRDELDDHNIRRVFHTIINNPDLNLNQLSFILNLRRDSIKTMLKELENKFPSL
jgi:predicted transcriptional regulator